MDENETETLENFLADSADLSADYAIDFDKDDCPHYVIDWDDNDRESDGTCLDCFARVYFEEDENEDEDF